MLNRRRSIVTGAVVGLALTAPLTALLYLGGQVGNLPMVAFDVLEGLTRIQILGGLVSKVIDIMVSVFSSIPGAATDQLSKGFEQLSAVMLFIALGALAGILYVLNRERWNRNGGLAIGASALMLALVLEFILKPGAVDQLLIGSLWLAVLFLGWGIALAWCIDRLLVPLVDRPGASSERRRFLLQFGGGIAALTLASWGLGRLLTKRYAAGTITLPTSATATSPALAANATESATGVSGQAFPVVAGTRPEITPNADFYRVDVNIASGPNIDQNMWSLTVEGLVSNPLSISYKDILGLPPIKQIATLECISNPVGGNLISTTEWMGFRLSDVLNQAQLKSDVKEIKFTCADGYTESLPLASAMDERALLVYAMNGEPLLPVHGFPLRLYTTNRYGMKNPKWITNIEAISDAYTGYWEARGWDKDAIVKSTSVIDAVTNADNGEGAVGGIAFSGARGISKVELSIDGGNWQEADLKAPLTPLTWRFWRFNWKAAKGPHQLRVRAVDGQGAAQIEATAPLHPDGASGYDAVNVTV